MKIYWRCAEITALFLLLAIGQFAAAEDTRWIIRGSGIYSFVAGDRATLTATLPPPVGEESLTHEITDGPGFGASIEYMWSDRLGIEAAVLLTYHDSEGEITNDTGTYKATDNMDLSTFTLGANYHFRTAGRTMWSVAVYVPLMFSSDADLQFSELNRTEVFQFDQDYGIGAKVGVDWPFRPGSPCLLSTEIRYMYLILESEEPGGDLNVDPLMLSVGVGYGF